MIPLLNLKAVFTGHDTADANLYLINFVGIRNFYNLLKVSHDVIEIWFFSFSLVEDVILRFIEFPYGSITNWNKFRTYFLERYLPPSRKLKLKDKINNFK